MSAVVLKMALMTLLPAAASAGLYLLDKKPPFCRLRNLQKQGLIGLVFGILAILGTEFGIPVTGAVINVRDAAPLCAGLFFGWPAGILAGILGGAERWLAALWGAGYYTRTACTIGTVFAGLFGAALRRWLFDDKKPTWLYALAIGSVAEVFHLLLIFVTNMGDVSTAFKVVRICAAPMIGCVGGAVMLAALVLAALSGERGSRAGKGQREITQAFQRGLLICVAIAFFVTNGFIFVLQSNLSRKTAADLLALHIGDVQADIGDAVDKDLLSITRRVASALNADPGFDGQTLARLKALYNVSEISVIDEKGVIVQSTQADYVGFAMRSGEQSAAFLVLNRGETELVQAYEPIARNTAIRMKYAGVALAAGGFVQVGYDAQQFQQNVDTQVVGLTRNRHVGENGYLLLADSHFYIVSDRNHHEGQRLSDGGLTAIPAQTAENTMFEGTVYGQRCYCMYGEADGYFIVAVVPAAEALFSRDISVSITAFMEVLIFAAMFILIYLLIKWLVVDNIHKINGSLAKITGGDLSVVVDVRTNREFASLSDDINATVARLKQSIAEAAARIDRELEFARVIQESNLPRDFPTLTPDSTFDLYAVMQPAKEVGGDFYDFYTLPGGRLAILAADVSGKGISGAMLMMKAKTLIRELARTGRQAAEILTAANEELCRNNGAEMFVTCWMGILELSTGLLEFANAGHNPPLIRRQDGQAVFLRTRPGFVLGGMEGIRYRLERCVLLPGDELFLYTDGVTEATDLTGGLFGNNRLLAAFRRLQAADARAVCTAIKAEVDAFVGQAPQFDDMTMVSLRIPEKNALFGPPAPERLPAVLAWADHLWQTAALPPRTVAKLDIALDEIFTNQCSYSGAAHTVLHADVRDGKATLVLADDGAPYDPLQAKEPDITLSAAERPIGGLGIHIVKKQMDRAEYHADRGWNILFLQKELSLAPPPDRGQDKETEGGAKFPQA